MEIPEEVRVVRELKERVKRFEKFNREYNDYKRFRERIMRDGYSLSSGILDIRFTSGFIKKIIEESKSLAVQKDHNEMFDEKLLETDLKVFEEWRERAEEVAAKLGKDDLAFNIQENKLAFQEIKAQMKKIPVYDKELFIKI